MHNRICDKKRTHSPRNQKNWTWVNICRNRWITSYLHFQNFMNHKLFNKLTDRYRILWIIIIVNSNISRQESSDPVESIDRPKRILWTKPWTIARTTTRESRDEIFGNFLLRFEHRLENSLYHNLRHGPTTWSI